MKTIHRLTAAFAATALLGAAPAFAGTANGFFDVRQTGPSGAVAAEKAQAPYSLTGEREAAKPARHEPTRERVLSVPGNGNHPAITIHD